MIITTDIIPPSLNKLARRIGWKVEMGYKRRYLQQFRNYHLLGLKEPPKVRYRVWVWVSRVRLLDKDNFYGGLKPLLDALKLNRLFWDDSPKWIDLVAEQRKVGNKTEQKVVIKISRTEDLVDA